MLRLSWCEKVVQQFAIEILRHADSGPLLQELLDLDQQYELLQLLQPKSENVLEPDFEFRGIFHATSSIGRKSLELELTVGYQLLLVNLTLLRGGEPHRVRLQPMSVFREVLFRQRLRR